MNLVWDYAILLSFYQNNKGNGDNGLLTFVFLLLAGNGDVLKDGFKMGLGEGLKV